MFTLKAKRSSYKCEEPVSRARVAVELATLPTPTVATDEGTSVRADLAGFASRLQELISGSGAPSLHAYALKSGVPDTALRKYLAGTSRPSLESLAAIAEFSQVSLDWLVLGRGSKASAGESEFLQVVEFAARLALQDGLGDTDQKRAPEIARLVAEYATAFYFAMLSVDPEFRHTHWFEFGAEMLERVRAARPRRG